MQFWYTRGKKTKQQQQQRKFIEYTHLQNKKNDGWVKGRNGKEQKKNYESGFN